MKSHRIFTAPLLILLFLSGFSWMCVAGEIDPELESIIERVEATFDKIEDYSVKVQVSVDIPNFRMPNKKIKVLYKKPDKISVLSPGFAIVPKSGIVPTPRSLMGDDIEQISVGEEFFNGRTYKILQLFPKEERGVREIKVYVNPERWTVDLVKNEFLNGGSSQLKVSYQKIQGFWLPDTSWLEMNLPQGIPRLNRPNIYDPSGGIESFEKAATGNMQGEVLLIFSDFRVNKGIKDSAFKQED